MSSGYTGPPLDWDKHEREILDLFIAKDQTWKQVRKHMLRVHNFDASENQYKRKFPRLKNLKEGEWVWIDQEIEKWSALGKRTEVLLHRRVLPQERVRREIQRIKARLRRYRDLPNPSPERLAVRALPSSPAGVPATLYSHMVPGIPENHLYSADFRSSYEHASSISPDILLPQTFCAPGNLSEPLRQATLERWPTHFYGPLSPSAGTLRAVGVGKIERLSWSQPACLDPRLLISNHMLSPNRSLRQLVEDMFISREYQLMESLIGTRLQSTAFLSSSSCLTGNLPFLQFLDQAEFAPLLGQSFPESKPLAAQCGSPSGAAAEVAANLGPSTLQWNSENASRLLSGFSHLIGLSSAKSTVAFVSLIYLASNNFLAFQSAELVLERILDELKPTDALVGLLTQLNNATAHAFAQGILNAAIRTKNFALVASLLGSSFKLNIDFIVLNRVFFRDEDSELLRLLIFHARRSTPRDWSELFRVFVLGGQFELARLVIENGFAADQLIVGEYNAMLFAIGSRKTSAVRFLLDAGCDANRRQKLSRLTDSKITALECAVLANNLDAVSLLLAKNAVVSGKVEGRDILEWSSLYAREIYEKLVGSRTSQHEGLPYGTLLVEAASLGIKNLQHHIRKDRPPQDLEQALCDSIRLGQRDAAAALLQCTAGVHFLDVETSKTALSLALEREDPVWYCELFLRHNPNAKRDPSVILKAVRTGNLDLIEFLVHPGTRVTFSAPQLEELIYHVLRHKNSLDIVKVLLHSGIPISSPFASKLNLLQLASLIGDIAVVGYLVEKKVDINARAPGREISDFFGTKPPPKGPSALQVASESCRLISGPTCDTMNITKKTEPTKMLRLLLQNGADPEIVSEDEDEPTLLERMAFGPRYGTWDETACRALYLQLLDANSPVNRANGKPSHAVCLAVERGWEDVLIRFLEPKRCLNTDFWYRDGFWYIKGCLMFTLVQLAAASGHISILKRLLAHGLSVHEAPAPKSGRTCLQAAAGREEENLDMVLFLLEQGAHVNADPARKRGVTALQGAAIRGHLSTVKLLIEHGANVNAEPSPRKGRYAIEGAAEQGRLDTVQLLLNAGAVRGCKRATVRAEREGHFAVAGLLKNAHKDVWDESDELDGWDPREDD